MAENYILLERIELNASAASITFSNIPQSGYTDLKIIYSARSDSGADDYLGIKYSFNSSTASFTYRHLYGTGSATGSGSGSTNNPSGYMQAGLTTANTFANGETYIPNYTSSNYKSFSTDSVIENNATLGFNDLLAGLWSNTAAISSMTLTPASGNFVQYSTFSLYGLAAVGTTPSIAPKALGGNITTDGTYWYHTFLSSGTFTPATALTCDYLVVAGGGGGGNRRSGGGGGGGYLSNSTTLNSSTAYTVTIGAGGSGGAGSTSQLAGSNGSNSVFGSLTSIGGGGGGGLNPSTERNGKTGGSSGGASFDGTVESATSGQGNAGGLGQSGANPDNGGGGGGGAGGAGGNMASGSSTGGTGGAGASSSISGTATIRAWGGAGGGFASMGAAATGSQGNGDGASGGGSAGAYTGGGGNGTTESGSSSAGGSGGSGIVIIRYPVA